MNSLINLLSNSKKFNSYIQEIEAKKSPVKLTGLTDVAKIYLTYATKEIAKSKILMITYNEIQAKRMVKDFSYFTDKVAFFPKREIVTYDYITQSKDLPYERIETLNKIQENKVDVIVTTVEALMQPMVAKEVLYQNILEFSSGKTYDLENLKQILVDLGYERAELIEGRGQFSIRGGIVDIAITNQKGVRVEFWGDEVDSIRYFNIASQRSIEEIKQIKIYPAHEFILEQSLEQVCKNIKEQIYDEKTQEVVNQDVELIQSGNYISKIDKYYHHFYTKKSNFLEYVNQKFLIFLDEQGKIQARTQNILQDNQSVQKMLIEKQKLVPQAIEAMFAYEDLQFEISKRPTILLEKQDANNGINFAFREVNFYKSSMELFLEEVEQAINQDKTVVTLAGNSDNAQ